METEITSDTILKLSPLSFADFTINQEGYCSYVCIHDSTPNTFVNYWTDFGDGYISSKKHPCHNYSDTGTFTILHHVWNQNFNQAASQNVVIKTFEAAAPLCSCTNIQNNYPELFAVTLDSDYAVNSQGNCTVNFRCQHVYKWMEGSSHFLQIQKTGTSCYPYIWIDTDNDGFFQIDELLFRSDDMHATYTDSIVVPKISPQLYNKPLIMRVAIRCNYDLSFNGCGLSHIFDYTVFIAPNTGIKPKADFEYWHDCTGKEVELMNKTEGAPNHMEWDFHDGTMAKGNVLSHVFPNSLNQKITLRAYNAFGADSITKVLRNPVHPQIKILGPSCVNYPDQFFTNDYPQVFQYYWSFKDDFSYQMVDTAIHTYTTNGPVIVTLSIVWIYQGLNGNNYSCSGFTQDTLHVGVAGINTIGQQLAYNIYPNPFKNETQLDFNLNASEKVQIEIYNSMGEKVQSVYREFNSGVQKVPLQLNKSGIYFVKISYKNQSYISKIVSTQ